MCIRDREEEDWYSYAELADKLLPYLKENGYNYLEIMPLSEHPCDESWGYQNTGFYSPTSRYGTAQELMEFIDACHQNDIGIIMDFVPVHFAVDGYAPVSYTHLILPASAWGSPSFLITACKEKVTASLSLRLARNFPPVNWSLPTMNRFRPPRPPWNS